MPVDTMAPAAAPQASSELYNPKPLAPLSNTSCAIPASSTPIGIANVAMKPSSTIGQKIVGFERA